MKIIELILDEESMANGIDAISIVSAPAIEENFIALNSQQEYKFATINDEKRLLLGPALIPNKPIYRRNGNEEFYVYFSSKTIRKANELFFKRGNHTKATLEHEVNLQDTTIVESWLIDDPEMDKSKSYGYSLPKGTWMVSMKIDNDEIWNEYVKTGKVKGFSIEGYFADKLTDKTSMSTQDLEEQDALEQLDLIRKTILGENPYDLESYSDYPSGVKNNAKRGIELNKKHNNKCATATGKARAQQLAQGKPISVSTIKRMYSYLSRAEEYYDPSDTSACGTISYLLWGGKAGLRWATSKLKQLDQLD